MKGAGARARLEALRDVLAANADCDAAQLLESEDEPGLVLLVVAWHGEALPALPQEATPKGAKVWRFRNA